MQQWLVDFVCAVAALALVLVAVGLPFIAFLHHMMKGPNHKGGSHDKGAAR